MGKKKGSKITILGHFHFFFGVRFVFPPKILRGDLFGGLIVWIFFFAEMGRESCFFGREVSFYGGCYSWAVKIIFGVGILGHLSTDPNPAKYHVWDFKSTNSDPLLLRTILKWNLSLHDFDLDNHSIYSIWDPPENSSTFCGAPCHPKHQGQWRQQFSWRFWETSTSAAKSLINTILYKNNMS